MPRRAALLTVTALLLVPALRAGEPRYDRYGGWTGLRAKATGFFRTERIDGQWWLVTPEGNAFWSKGVNAIHFAGDYCPKLGYAPYGRVTKAKYGDAERFARETARRLRGWGFNTAGSWSGPEMARVGLAYTVNLDLAGSLHRGLWLEGGFPDVFDPRFAEGVERRAARLCGPRKDDPWLLGYFTDNELHWGPDWRTKDNVLTLFLKMPQASPGRRQAERFLRERGRGGAAPTAADEQAFLELAAGRYFRLTAAAIRKADPNHLILGCRFALPPTEPVYRALKGQADVVSVHSYDHDPPVRLCRHATEATGLPCMLTEFSFKAKDSGLPNTRGGGKPVATQQDRAELMAKVGAALERLPGCVGYHWFEYADEPPLGRFDGEDCNYGLVDNDDNPWRVLVDRFTKVNQGLEQRRRAAR